MNKSPPAETHASTPWNESDKEVWRGEQFIRRSYRDEVGTKIEALKGTLDVVQYGVLSCDPGRYPLYLIKTRHSDRKKKTILITGGVHGYETSGVHGALKFFEGEVHKYTCTFNFVCAPCISPWAYETINRWNANAIDPNRSFVVDSPAEECREFLNAMKALKLEIHAHFDLHETTDTDNTVFRPALEKRDGVVHEFSEIPDGFYTVGDAENPQREFQKAVIDRVRRVTHIAPADVHGKIIGVRLEQDGVINYPLKKLSLCAGFSSAQYVTTTEVYPDSPKVTDEVCANAQVAAITGGLDYLVSVEPG
ncbi:MAG: succinylglutamate desuccinylase/aspartoacylase family protein [Methylotenera sp.]|nr:succinylglutamate desuccinylase/aspartoacylase family protein [Oligoflexia bacterium]